MKKKENYRNAIKPYIIRAGMTMTKLVDCLADEYGWSGSVPNLSSKLRRNSLRHGEAVKLADTLGYDIEWQRRSG
jgi:predicted DNA-binding ribbon-helix-helix protein